MDPVAPEDSGDVALGECDIPLKPPLHASAAPTKPRLQLRSGQVHRAALAVYAITLGLIGIWPVRVDSSVGPLLRRVTSRIPLLTYDRIEFGANILLFVPFGLLLALILVQRHIIVPIAIVTAVGIESLQALLLATRTPSVTDIVANLTGACIGLLLVVFLEWSRRRRFDRTDTSPPHHL